MCPGRGAAQAQRSDALQTRDRHDVRRLERSRICGAPLARCIACGTQDDCSLHPLNHFLPTHIPLQHVRHRDAAALLLIVLHHGDQRAADRDALSR